MGKYNVAAAWILLLSIVHASLYSCGNQAAENDTTTSGLTVTTGDGSGETAEPSAYDKLPDQTYNGYTFTILTRDAEHHTKEVYSEQQTGEIVNDAVYTRNNAVEERFAISIEPLKVSEADESTLTAFITKSVMAGDHSFDLALAHTVYAGAVALEGVLYNWKDMKYNDFEADWWNTSLADELTIQGNQYLAVSDLCISAIDYTWAMVFNKQLCEDYGVEDLYALVEKGQWTIDKFAEIIQQCSADLNGDGKQGFEDRYGFVTHDNSAINNWMFASDQKVTEMDEDGWPVLCANTAKMVSLTEKMYDILFTGNHTQYFSDTAVKTYGAASHDEAVAKFFSSDQALIAALRLYVIEDLRSMENDFGIIPFPKWDEGQDAYYTHVDGHAPLMCLPKNLQDPDRTSVIIEALSYESRKNVLPAVYDIVLDSKYARDERSTEMLDILLDGRTYTFGYIYDNWKGMQWALTTLMKNKSKDYASYYATNVNRAENQLQTVIDGFTTIIN